MGEPLFDLIFKYRQKQLLAVLNVCFDMLKRTKRNETERNALNQPKLLSTTSRRIYYTITSPPIQNFIDFCNAFLSFVCCLNCATISVVVDDIDHLLSMSSFGALVHHHQPLFVIFMPMQRESSCHFRIKFILRVRFQSEKCENPLNDVLNGAKMGVSTLFQFITIRQVNLVEHINKIDFV